MSCFDRSIKRAIELRRMGYDTNQIAGMIFASCGSMTSSRLVARAAKVFVNGEKRRAPRRSRVEWVS